MDGAQRAPSAYLAGSGADSAGGRAGFDGGFVELVVAVRRGRLVLEEKSVSDGEARTDYDIGAGFKPDVLWFRLDPSKHERAAPIAAFEIEFGSAQAIAKSMASLKHAFDLGTQKLFLILPSGRVEVAKLRLDGAFHEIADAIRVLPIEGTDRMTSLELARYLGF